MADETIARISFDYPVDDRRRANSAVSLENAGSAADSRRTISICGLSICELARRQRVRQSTRFRMSKIPIAIVGVGNCASSLVQGISFYGGFPRNGASVGLMHQQVGPYWPDDIEVVAAFDVDRRKVGIDVSEAIFAPPNCTKIFCEKIPKTGTIVRMGCVLDGVGAHMSEYDPAPNLPTA